MAKFKNKKENSLSDEFRKKAHKYERFLNDKIPIIKNEENAIDEILNYFTKLETTERYLFTYVLIHQFVAIGFVAKEVGKFVRKIKELSGE
ncbi:hypothetical protein FW755_11625 [Lonepinella koalarum]|uniref:Uncharacterized protein n=1 Tax=Lonepinella koalarum TaxID=53417 RepID=A0A4R1L004_9PAST|nr:hypothetical protein [Lonepinella koalarum]MDH2925581.1 hypothetical protein [Lonepinella koalarum]MDH2927265.1 hypothetical protein [Lonepinella koalarum]MDH2927277.1 hypothetical protein [Lonepinella koalarum]MDH2927301.1 hypothetical protein [Lonepinella koalarum]TCK70143.1 hypothetical protein EV692_1370 [Lonepinella koalarum]